MILDLTLLLQAKAAQTRAQKSGKKLDWDENKRLMEEIKRLNAGGKIIAGIQGATGLQGNAGPQGYTGGSNTPQQSSQVKLTPQQIQDRKEKDIVGRYIRNLKGGVGQGDAQDDVHTRVLNWLNDQEEAKKTWYSKSL